MYKIISLINLKGGVGKTTLSIGLADYLAKNNHKVLIIDIDPQFNATQALVRYYYKYDGNFYRQEIVYKEKTISLNFTPQTNINQSLIKLLADDLIFYL
ncbi:hypothetical protein AN643_01480 [Candidatus Epulonipiscioides saccharophilum]|nr:hypothetical protein AN643_01480 [Epulopiscium sp. SCG-B10WGA-EpuloB]